MKMRYGCLLALVVVASVLYPMLDWPGPIPGIVEKTVDSPDGRYVATLVNRGGGAISSDTFLVYLRPRSEKGADYGDEVAMIGRGIVVGNVVWRSNQLLAIKTNSVDGGKAGFYRKDRSWRDVHIAYLDINRDAEHPPAKRQR